MKKYQFWNKKDALYTPSGKAYTAEEYLAAHAWARLPGVKCVINTGAINCAVFLEFENMKAACIKQGMIIPEQASDEEILTLIEEWETAAYIQNQRHKTGLRRHLNIKTSWPRRTKKESKGMTYEMIKKNFDRKLWNAQQVLMCVKKGLFTKQEANSILNMLEKESKTAAQ